MESRTALSWARATSMVLMLMGFLIMDQEREVTAAGSRMASNENHLYVQQQTRRLLQVQQAPDVGPYEVIFYSQNNYRGRTLRLRSDQYAFYSIVEQSKGATDESAGPNVCNDFGTWPECSDHGDGTNYACKLDQSFPVCFRPSDDGRCAKLRTGRLLDCRGEDAPAANSATNGANIAFKPRSIAIGERAYVTIHAGNGKRRRFDMVLSTPDIQDTFMGSKNPGVAISPRPHDAVIVFENPTPQFGRAAVLRACTVTECGPEGDLRRPASPLGPRWQREGETLWDAEAIENLGIRPNSISEVWLPNNTDALGYDDPNGLFGITRGQTGSLPDGTAVFTPQFPGQIYLRSLARPYPDSNILPGFAAILADPIWDNIHGRWGDRIRSLAFRRTRPNSVERYADIEAGWLVYENRRGTNQVRTGLFNDRTIRPFEVILEWDTCRRQRYGLLSHAPSYNECDLSYLESSNARTICNLSLGIDARACACTMILDDCHPCVASRPGKWLQVDLDDFGCKADIDRTFPGYPYEPGQAARPLRDPADADRYRVLPSGRWGY